MDRFTRRQTDRYIRDQNVKHYRHLLGHVTEETNRQTILILLGEEQQKQLEAGDLPAP
jgi:hypothetical protein